MSASVFDLQNIEPDERMLSQELGKAFPWFEEISSHIERNYGNFSSEWKYYGQKSGWILKLFHKKRNVLFIVPCSGFFRTVFTFGEKSFYRIIDSNLPVFIKHELLSAKKFSEGRTIQIDITKHEHTHAIIELIKIKLDN